jgi:putative DNA primase/helicase
LTWQAHGLQDPPEVLEATAEYRTAEDRLGTFIAERCLLGPDYRIRTSELWTSYREWCKANGETEGTATAFGSAVSDRGITKDRGKRWYLGITIVNPEHENEASL